MQQKLEEEVEDEERARQRVDRGSICITSNNNEENGCVNTPLPLADIAPKVSP
jgi:hypothetical protein